MTPRPLLQTAGHAVVIGKDKSKKTKMAIFAMTILQFVFMLIESWHLIRNIVNVRINILEMLRTMGNLVGMLQVSLLNYGFNINFFCIEIF